MATEAPTPAQIKETLELLSEKGKLTEEQLLKEAQLNTKPTRFTSVGKNSRDGV